MSVEGLETLQSAFSAEETLERLKSAIGSAGLTVFAHIDQAAAAKDVGLTLPPLDLVIFGNPRAGTPLMAHTPTLGIDLPLKALVWQDVDGKIWLSFNLLSWVAARHLPPISDSAVLDKMMAGQIHLMNEIAGLAKSEAD